MGTELLFHMDNGLLQNITKGSVVFAVDTQGRKLVGTVSVVQSLIGRITPRTAPYRKYGQAWQAYLADCIDVSPPLPDFR